MSVAIGTSVAGRYLPVRSGQSGSCRHTHYIQRLLSATSASAAAAYLVLVVVLVVVVAVLELVLLLLLLGGGVFGDWDQCSW